MATSSDQITQDTPLLGTWSLLEWHNEDEDGALSYTLGKDATGYISYSADGFVFVHIMAAARRDYAINDPFGGTLAEDSAAMKSQITYAGRYDFLGDKVVHHVTQASCPNWVGTKQHRNVQFMGDQLQLSAAGAMIDGKTVTARLLWERAV